MKNRLDVPSLDQRLQAQLEEALGELDATWLAVIELGVESTPLVPRWCASAGAPTPSSPPDPRLLDVVADIALPVSALRAPLDLPPGVSNEDCAVVSLNISPRLSTGAQACLCVAPASCARGAVFEELLSLLQRALCDGHRERLAEVVMAAVEQAADPVELSDRDGRLFYVNSAWERFTGYERGDAVGLTAGQLLRDPEGSAHDPHFYRFAMAELHAGRSWLRALSGRASGGRHVFAEAHVSPFQLEQSALRGHIAVRRDLSSRSSRDQALLAAHREFRAVLSALTDGVCVLLSGRIYFANAAFAKILGTPDAALSGRPFVELLHESDRAQFEAEHASGVSRVRALKCDGASRFVEISSAGEVSFDGHAVTILLIRDTTDYQLAQEQLARAEKLSALGAMAAGVAHEINNPLAYVALNLELLLGRAAELLHANEREALVEAIEGVARIREIASELHTYSGREEPGPAGPVDLSRAVTSALNLVNNELRQWATLVRRCEPNLMVVAREGQLVQVLVNVLLNAIQALPTPTPSEHTVTVTTRSLPSDKVEIAITDTGVGIPAQLLPRLFDPFATTKRRGEGSGLGLAICRRIVDEFGGSIGLSSDGVRGTTATILLQRASVATPPRVSTLPSEAGHVPGLRVLVVEDELAIGRAIQRLLAMHKVTRVADGERALLLLEHSTAFDVVLCDLMMPGLSGAELYRSVAELWPELAERFIFMTGGTLTPDSRAFLDNFTGLVLWKPFTLEALHECLRNLGQGGSRLGVNLPVAPAATEMHGREEGSR